MDHEHERREHAEEFWRRMPERERKDVRSVARESLGRQAAERGVPVEELVTPELVEEIAVRLLEHLHSQSEGEGVREDKLYEAVMFRMLAERAELRSWLDRRRDS